MFTLIKTQQIRFHNYFANKKINQLHDHEYNESSRCNTVAITLLKHLKINKLQNLTDFVIVKQLIFHQTFPGSRPKTMTEWSAGHLQIYIAIAMCRGTRTK